MTGKADKPWWRDWRIMAPLSLAIAALAWWAHSLQVDALVIASGVLVVGLVTNVFAWLLGLLALVPVVGPILVGLLTTGFIMLINAVGSIVSFVAIRRGYGSQMLTYKGVTIALIIGIVIGFVIGKLV